MILSEIQSGIKGLVKDLSELKFLDSLHENAQNAYAVVRKNPLYADLGDSEYVHLDADKLKAGSAFFVDQLAAESSTWKLFPDRTRCVKLYNRKALTDNDKPHVVIPFNGERLGICSKPTFYRSFPVAQELFGSVTVDNGAINDWLQALASGLTKLGYDVKFEDPTTYSAFKSCLTKLDKEIAVVKGTLRKDVSSRKGEGLDDAEIKALNSIAAGYKTDMFSFLEHKLDPDLNGFKASRIESYTAHAEPAALWYNGPCLGVRLDTYLDLLKRGKLK